MRKDIWLFWKVLLAAQATQGPNIELMDKDMYLRKEKLVLETCPCAESSWDICFYFTPDTKMNHRSKKI